MLTVLESIQLSTDYLEKKGIESPRYNAEILLTKVLNCPRMQLYLSFDRPLKEDEITQYRQLILRRSKHEPLQYILGYVEFYGLRFNINSSVLIPRQETEILVETVLQKADKNRLINILDIGTGSGNIAVSVAKNLNLTKIVAVDKSPEALLVAKENAKLNNVEDKVEFLQTDILTGEFSPSIKFDIIVSNPPYVSKNEYPKLQAEITEYEPRIALTDDTDGFSFYKKIIELCSFCLVEKGKILFEVAQGQAGSVAELLDKNKFENIEIVKDYLKINRVVTGEKL